MALALLMTISVAFTFTGGAAVLKHSCKLVRGQISQTAFTPDYENLTGLHEYDESIIAVPRDCGVTLMKASIKLNGTCNISIKFSDSEQPGATIHAKQYLSFNSSKGKRERMPLNKNVKEYWLKFRAGNFSNVTFITIKYVANDTGGQSCQLEPNPNGGPSIRILVEDVDECEGGIHDCRATKCNNTMGSYECINTPSFSTTSVAPSRSSPSTMSVATTMSSSSTMSVATTTSSSSIKTTVHSTTQVKENRNCLISHNNTQGSTQPAPVDEGIGTTVDQQATCVPISLVIALTIVTAVLIILLAVTAVAWRMQRNYIRSCELKWESHSNLDGLERIVSGKRHGREAGLPETSVELLNITSTAPTTIPGYINVGQPALIQANQDLYATIRVQEPVDGRLASIKTPDNERAAQSSQPIIDHSDYRTPTKQPHLQREVGATSREASQDVESKARLGSDVYDAVAIHDSERSSKGRTQSTSSGAKHIGNVYNAAMKADQHQYTNVKNHEHRTKDRATPKPPSSQRQDQTRHDHQRKQRYSSWHCGEETATSAVLIPQPHSDDAKRRHSFSPTADTLTHPELYRSPSVNSSSSKHSSKSPVIISQNVGTAEINSVSRPAELTPSVAKAAGVQTPVYARVDLPTKEAKRKHICTTTTDSTQKQTATEFPSITSTASVDAIVAQPDAHRATRPPPAESPKRRFPYTEVVFAKPPKVQLAPFPNLAAGNGAKGTEATGKSATIYASLAYSCAEN